jgi:prevent-host-death family protein
MPQVNIHDAKTHLSRLVKEAAKGKEIVIAIAGKPAARLVALEAAPAMKRKPGRLKGRIRVGADFDAPLSDELLEQFSKGPVFP